MKKKYFAILMILILMINFYPQKSYASTDTLPRVMPGSTGEKILVGFAEKGGITWADKAQQQRFTEYWNAELEARRKLAASINDQVKVNELRNLQNTLVNAKPSDLKDVTKGFGRFVMNAGMFASGVSIVYDVVTKIGENNEQQKQMERMAGLEDALENGDVVRDYGGFHFEVISQSIVFTDGVFFDSAGSNSVSPWVSVSGYIRKVEFDVKLPDGKERWRFHTTFFGTRADGQTFGNTKISSFDLPSSYFLPTKVISNIPDASHIPTRSEVPLFNEIGLGGVPDLFPEGIDITVPEGDWDEVGWNEPISKPDTNPNPNPNPQPQPNPELNPQPEENPLPNGNGTEIPTEQIPPSSDACKSPAESVLEFLKNWIIGNFACFDWDKLKMAGGFFTNKFPFSLPWDIGRGLDAVFGGLTESDKLPEFPIKIADWEGTIKIPSFFHSWFPILRIMILVMFDISLIYAVRKLLGGAS